MTLHILVSLGFFYCKLLLLLLLEYQVGCAGLFTKEISATTRIGSDILQYQHRLSRRHPALSVDDSGIQHISTRLLVGTWA